MRPYNQVLSWAWLFCLIGLPIGCVTGTGPEVGDEPAEPLVDRRKVPQWNGSPMAPVTDSRRRPADRFVLTVRMELISVKVPIGMVSSSERLWRYLDEELADLRTTAALNRNGFRVGCGNVDDWDPVGKLLRRMTGRTLVRSPHVVVPGRPLAVTMGPARGGESIFVYNSRGELRGRDYPSGENVLMLTCRLNSDDPSDVLVQGVPLVRSDRPGPRYVKTDAGIELNKEPVEEPIDELEFTVRVPRGRYLVIGPGAAAWRKTSPGNRFLVKNEDGLQYETVVVVVPEVYAAELPREGV